MPEGYAKIKSGKVKYWKYIGLTLFEKENGRNWIRDEHQHSIFPFSIRMPCGKEYEFKTREDLPKNSLKCECGDIREWVVQYIR